MSRFDDSARPQAEREAEQQAKAERKAAKQAEEQAKREAKEARKAEERAEKEAKEIAKAEAKEDEASLANKLTFGLVGEDSPEKEAEKQAKREGSLPFFWAASVLPLKASRLGRARVAPRPRRSVRRLNMSFRFMVSLVLEILSDWMVERKS